MESLEDEELEARANARLVELFSRADIWQENSSMGKLYPAIHPRSRMARYDKRTAPLQLSHAVQGVINVAIEHQHAIAALIRDAKVLHYSAPFTLNRTAVECAATAYWMLYRTDSAREPVRRLAIFQGQERYDYAEVSRLVKEATGGEMPETLDKRKEWVADIIEKNGITDIPKAGLKMTKVIQEVDAAIGDDAHIEIYWRMASGFAHGKQWPSINALVRKEVGASAPGVATFRIENNYSRVAWGANIAYGLTNKALALYFEAAREPRR